jgi:formyl-CoA transferase
MSVTGEPGREPLLTGGYQAEYQAGLQAFAATALAAQHADSSDLPQHVDLSAQECMTSALELYLPWIAGFGREITPRRRGNVRSALVGIFPTSDAYIGLHVMPRQWPAFAAAMGRPELVDDPRFATDRARLKHNDDLEAIVYEWASRQTAEDAYRTLGARRVPVSTINTIPDLLASDHLRARDYFQRIGHPLAGEQTYPGAPIRMSSIEWTPGRAPLLGEHTREVLCDELGLTATELTRLRAAGVV